MKIIYVSDDLEFFTTKEACQQHELANKMGDLSNDIRMFDEDGHELKDICLEKTYFDVHTIEVYTEKGVETLREIGKAVECSYDYVDSIGTWEWKICDGFRKVEEDE